MINSNFGQYYEDFIISDNIIHSLSKTIFESDNNFFSLLTMNHHPIHINLNYAENEKYGKLLVVGTLTFSIIVGITVPEISGKAIANLEYSNIKHLNPVFIGDTLYAKSTILQKSTKSMTSRAGIIHVETIGFNQNNVNVIKFERKVLVKKLNLEK